MKEMSRSWKQETADKKNILILVQLMIVGWGPLEIEEEESIDDYSKTVSTTEQNIAGFHEALVTPLALGTIDTHPPI